MTPEELTVLLYQSGSLRQGRVAEVQEAKNEAFNSHIHHLQVSYSPDVVPLLPSALLSIAAEDPVLPVLGDECDTSFPGTLDLLLCFMR